MLPTQLPALAESFSQTPLVLPESLLCPVCSVVSVISKEFLVVGLENSKAICVVAGSEHSASLTGGYQLSG